MDSSYNPGTTGNYEDAGNEYNPDGYINALFYHRMGNANEITSYGYVDDALLATKQTDGNTIYQYFLLYWRFQSTYSYSYKMVQFTFTISEKQQKSTTL